MRNDKIYEYNGKYYSETDHSLNVDDGLWGGDLYALYWDASHDDMEGILCETTVYYNAYNPEVTYESAEELIEDTFENCTVELEKGEEV